jgi:putative transposase
MTMPNYRRYFVPGGMYFFTVTLLERKGDLLVRHIDALRDAVRRVKRLYPFEIIAWVVLPDHLHCIWRLPAQDVDFPTRWRLIKLLFCKMIPKGERLSVVRLAKGERGIWHRRYWEHVLRDEADFSAHMDYVHFNPVKHGLAKSVQDWPFSTFHRYVRAGLYPADWAGSPSSDGSSGYSKV